MPRRWSTIGGAPPSSARAKYVRAWRRYAATTIVTVGPAAGAAEGGGPWRPRAIHSEMTAWYLSRLAAVPNFPSQTSFPSRVT
jgi:hypothetical protein